MQRPLPRASPALARGHLEQQHVSRIVTRRETKRSFAANLGRVVLKQLRGRLQRFATAGGHRAFDTE